MSRVLPTILSALLAGCAGTAPTTPQAPPYWPGATWATRTPAAAGFDPERLAAAARFALDHRTTSFLVVRGGRIVLERYAGDGGRDVARGIASATKSITAILVGMALDAGRFRDLDQPVADFLPAWRGTPKAAITLRHLLSMTSGLDPQGFRRQRPTGDQFTHNAGMPLVAAPGSRWQYNTPAYHLTFRLLEKATGQPLPEWSRSRLLGPLGMTGSTWNSQPRDGVTNYTNLSCTARDMARFGLFVLRGGRWRDRQLIRPASFRAATTPSQSLNPAYGLLFWLNAEPGYAAGGRQLARRFPGAPRDLVACLGAGGQQIVVIPSQDLVLVRQGEAPGDPEFAPRCVRMVLAALVDGGFSVAPPPWAPPLPAATDPPSVPRLDTDGDGRLSAAEFSKAPIAGRRPGLFARLDRNGDGFLDRDELRRWRGRRRR